MIEIFWQIKFYLNVVIESKISVQQVFYEIFQKW